ncbi:unnamed protein product [Vitrella brassicaformis CCMP3155]|uniref:endo-1,4-beta-xylanase n=2 Tax=Vitrella brassicaformis TaxID=1169539 RepID=A0A0G4H1F2_VITBC|nr:unnamed protein product [Vitrella brassicaformis CCMP3155]|eukprot:CEM37286.1 unnamed protein product [Vitrella brassicaformis CCMP3155]
MEHFRDNPSLWSIDVVNEVLSDDQPIPKQPRLRESYWTKMAGIDDWPALAFRKAKQIARNRNKLRSIMNEYGINSVARQGGWRKADAMYHYCRQLRKKGVPVDGVGVQAHINIAKRDFHGVRKQFKRLGEIGLEAQITEVEAYKAMVRVCMDAANCTGVGVWGVSDDGSWLHSESRNETPLLFDSSLKKKRAFYGVKEAMQT